MANDQNETLEGEKAFNVGWHFSMIIVLFAVDYKLRYRFELIWYAFLFILYRFFFMNFWTISDQDANFNRCLCTNRSIPNLLYSFDKPRRWFTVFSRSTKITRKNQQFYNYKFFIMIALRLLLISMSFIMTDIRYSWFIIIYAIVFIVFYFLALPSIFNTVHNDRLIKW